jgi:hypothetical protein
MNHREHLKCGLGEMAPLSSSGHRQHAGSDWYLSGLAASRSEAVDCPEGTDYTKL